MKFSLYSQGRRIKEDFLLRQFHEEETFGVFESLRTYHGKIFREEEHLERLKESAKTMNVPTPIRISELKRELRTALEAFYGARPQKGSDPSREDCFLRLTVWDGKIFVMIGQRRHSKSIYRTGVSLQTSPVRRTHPNAFSAQIKTTAYQNAVWASLAPSSAETYEWIFMDQEGYVTEVRIGNIFIVKGSDPTNRFGVRPQLLTPPQTGILNGVTRRVVIKCALQLRLEIQERPLTRHEIYNAEEAFLTNTSWEILPISKLDGRRIGRKIPGPVTSQLHRAFRKIVEQEC